MARARAFAKLMKDAPLAIIDKRRSAHNIAESLTVIGEVKGKTAILIDDMIDTGGTICSGANLLKKEELIGYLHALHMLFFLLPLVKVKY